MEKRFDVNAWDYNNGETLLDIFMAFSKADRNAAGYQGWRVVEFPRDSRGKAFGLCLCGVLAIDSKFRVPDWIDVKHFGSLFEPRIQHWLSVNRGFYMVRSSSRTEDWIDPRSGVEKSTWCIDEDLTKVLEAHFAASSESVVVQKYVHGCGCVIDVGYSQLLERPIIRIAQGNPSSTGDGIRYTSATWDHEARVAIFDARSGEHLLGSELGFRDSNPFPELVQELIKILENPSIDFGIQLEVIVNPGSNLWHLVQIRPSPDSIRGMKEKPEIKGNLISTTGKVNKAGMASGELLAARFDEGDERLHRKAQMLNDRWKPEGFDLTGKVVMWDYGSLKYNSAQTIHGAGLAGAVAQITAHSLFTNSGHGTSSAYSEQGFELPAWKKGRGMGLQLGRIGRDVYADLLFRARDKKPTELYVVSDGLVGQIYLLS